MQVKCKDAGSPAYSIKAVGGLDTLTLPASASALLGSEPSEWFVYLIGLHKS